MEQLHKLHGQLDQLLVSHFSQIETLGLFRGKMGLSLYFFEASRYKQDNQLSETAEKILEEVYNHIHQTPMSTYFDNGLAGIAWAVHHLVRQGHVDGEINGLLAEIDHILYKVIAEKTGELDFGFKRGLLGYLLYVLDRINMAPSNNLDKYTREIFISQAILIINRLHQMVEDNLVSFYEPKDFNLFWDLPNYLFLLAEIRNFRLLPDKTARMIKDITPIVLSIHPRHAGNRMNLLLGMEKLDIEEWKDHARALQNRMRNFGLSQFGLRNKSLYFENGLAGLIFLDKQLTKASKNWKGIFQNPEIIEETFGFLKKSEYWDCIKHKLKNEMGLLYGITGINLSLLYLLNRQVSLYGKD